jgi:hypothetical protein
MAGPAPKEWLQALAALISLCTNAHPESPNYEAADVGDDPAPRVREHAADGVYLRGRTA